MTSAGSQLECERLQTGGRQVKTGAAGGGRQTKQQTDGDEAIEGEREYAREMCLGGKGTRVNLGGGIGGPETSFEDRKK